MESLSLIQEPFKFDQLDKGHLVPTEAIEQWANLRRDHKLFSLAMLKCREYISALLRRQGLMVVVVCQGDLLRLLTDREATDYLHEQFLRREQSLVRIHRKASEVDVGQLSARELERHRLRLQMQAFHVDALERAAKRKT